MKNRLFIFGDSTAFNYFSKKHETHLPYMGNKNIRKFAEHYNNFGHWIDHMNHFYDVYSYAKGGASNEQIIYQLGNLPDYINGDRVVIIFSNPSRFRWVMDKRVYGLAPNGIYRNFMPKESINLIESQYIERNELWIDDSLESEEQKFLNILPILLKKYNPVLTTWCEQTALHTNSIDMIDTEIPELYTSMDDETNGICKDGHLGVFGNYELFKFISKKLSIDYTDYIFNPTPFEIQLI